MVSLRTLPIAFRALFSSFLILIGVGYLMALSFMYLVVIKPHQQMGEGLVAGISDQYHGLPKGKTLIESVLMGPMADKISVADRTRLLTWVHDGAKAQTYPQVKPIFAANCISCHMAEAQSIPPLASFEAVQKVAKADTGTSITDLAKVSHIHLFGISIIFLLTGAVFALSETPVWLRVSLVVVPYLTIVLDIGSWWLTKYLDPAFFAYVVIVGGVCMGLALGAQVLIALWEMWVVPLGKAISARRSSVGTRATPEIHRV
jgi:cytochrome c553